MENRMEQNVVDLELELGWFSSVLNTRFKLYFGQESEVADVFDIDPPDISGSDSEYARFVNHYQLSFAERFAIVLSMVPHIRPQLLDIFFTKNKTFDRRFTEFGGISQNETGDFIPTFETLAFILAANNLDVRFSLQILFDPQHFFAKHNILSLLSRNSDSAFLKAPLQLSIEHLSLFTAGIPHRPNFSTQFPAQHIQTNLQWSDLVLHPGTIKQIEEIKTWIEHGKTLMEDWGMAPKLRPGYRSLFYGPPGTGKTMTACLLGKTTDRDVYKVDLSMVVSKYIGETEKNLAQVFDQAQHKGWILFFDEADALFGKRSATRNAHDRYANQEISFLLQRIETFDGIAILASNIRENLDSAFSRRFESIIYFPMPRAQERLQLWKNGFSRQAEFDDELNLEKVASDHTLSGGAIMNIVRYASLQALKKGENRIAGSDVMQGIRREFDKNE
ncbi:MAG: ATP-binding protein [Calditrichaeota bacterium]|nr:MAG: ATP-binding protein [Calditrichota bacterium]